MKFSYTYFKDHFKGLLKLPVVLITLGVTGGFLISVVVIELFLGSNHSAYEKLAADVSTYGSANIFDQMSQKEEQKPDSFLQQTGNATLTMEDKKNGYAYLGQANVELMKFSLTPERDGSLRQLTVTWHGFGDSSNLTSVQLYREGKLLGSMPFFDGKAVFENLHGTLVTKTPAHFEIKGKIAKTAHPGDLVEIGFKDANSFTIFNDDANNVGVNGHFPLKGNEVRIIGDRKN